MLLVSSAGGQFQRARRAVWWLGVGLGFWGLRVLGAMGPEIRVLALSCPVTGFTVWVQDTSPAPPVSMVWGLGVRVWALICMLAGLGKRDQGWSPTPPAGKVPSWGARPATG